VRSFARNTTVGWGFLVRFVLFLALVLPACGEIDAHGRESLPSVPSALAGCEGDYNLDYHEQRGKLDICSIEDQLPDAINILINWGNRPNWIDNDSFVFLSNAVGDVYRMDLGSNTVRLLTGHFAHSGFARVHVLSNGDLLLHGPHSNPQPPSDPLVIYEKGRFNGYMSILKAPYDGVPIPLNVHAWEGIAVSRESDLIAWSDTDKPFFGANIIETALNYILGHSNLWTGVLVYDDNGIPAITQRKRILCKQCRWGDFTFYEPQDFKGTEDQKLLFSAYGPTAEGSSDMFVYNFKKGKAVKKPADPLGYNEWEGIHPQYDRAFYERDPDASNFSGPEHIDSWIWNFSTKSPQAFSRFRREDGFSIGNAVFSPDGRWVLMSADSPLGNESNTPGYSVGIVLIDYKSWEANPEVLE